MNAVSGAIGKIDMATHQDAVMVEHSVQLSGRLGTLNEDLQRLVPQFRIGEDSLAVTASTARSPRRARPRP